MSPTFGLQHTHSILPQAQSEVALSDILHSRQTWEMCFG